MSIEAVIGYFRHAGVAELDDAERLVARAAEAGFAFDSAELRATIQVGELLRAVQRDDLLCAEIRSAAAPMARLLAAGRASGFEVKQDDVLAVLGALQRLQGELSSEQLDHVAGGARGVPEVGDEVLVAFVTADTQSPYVLGSLWNSDDKPPTRG